MIHCNATYLVNGEPRLVDIVVLSVAEAINCVNTYHKIYSHTTKNTKKESLIQYRSNLCGSR